MTEQNSLFDFKKTQHKKLLELLHLRGSNGIGSYERFKLGIFQMPTRIHELIKKGHNIVSLKHDKTRQVFYILMD